MQQKESITNFFLFFLGIGYIILIILKITNSIDWSWDWVLSPLWVIGGALGIIILLLGAFLLGILVDDPAEEIEEITDSEPPPRWIKGRNNKKY